VLVAVVVELGMALQGMTVLKVDILDIPQ